MTSSLDYNTGIMAYHQRFDIKPKAKGRPRLARNGRAYTPKATRDYERAVAEAYMGPKFPGPIGMSVAFDGLGFDLSIFEADPARSRLRADLDNLFKSLGDSLNGVAYIDDRQIVWLGGSK